LEHQHISDPLDELVSQAPDGPVDLDWVYVGAPSEPICTDGVCSIPGLPEYGGSTAAACMGLRRSGTNADDCLPLASLGRV
jgi:hypothetical protein